MSGLQTPVARESGSSRLPTDPTSREQRSAEGSICGAKWTVTNICAPTSAGVRVLELEKEGGVSSARTRKAHRRVQEFLKDIKFDEATTGIFEAGEFNGEQGAVVAFSHPPVQLAKLVKLKQVLQKLGVVPKKGKEVAASMATSLLHSRIELESAAVRLNSKLELSAKRLIKAVKAAVQRCEEAREEVIEGLLLAKEAAEHTTKRGVTRDFFDAGRASGEAPGDQSTGEKEGGSGAAALLSAERTLTRISARDDVGLQHLALEAARKLAAAAVVGRLCLKISPRKQGRFWARQLRRKVHWKKYRRHDDSCEQPWWQWRCRCMRCPSLKACWK
ncbi:MAG: hypothetical protein SGPRY_005859 [Prymnesium sp.]